MEILAEKLEVGATHSTYLEVNVDLTYATIDGITRRLSGRLTVVNMSDYGITGITGTTIGTDLIQIVGEGVEEFMNIYLGMIYEMPLLNTHAYLRSIAEKLIIGEVYSTYFPVGNETDDVNGNFGDKVRTQALNEFQVLFHGLGIFIPGTDTASLPQNDENKDQMQSKMIFLPGERLKKFIGYDFNGDGLSDTDLFKSNANINPSFYTTGDLEHWGETESIVNGIRVRPIGKHPNPNRAEIDFYGWY